MNWLGITIVIILNILLWYCQALLLKIVTTIRRQSGHTQHPMMAQYINVMMGMMLLSTISLVWIGYTFWNYNQEQNSRLLSTKEFIKKTYDSNQVWRAPDLQFIALEKNRDLITYGRQLIANTSDYLGPKGLVKQMSNGMNCQNCHLDAGTKPYGNNFSAVWSTYPKFRARSGTAETIRRRINDCFQRSLNGDTLHPQSKEMKAIVAYIQWLGQAVPKNKSPKGVGLYKVKNLNRAADPLQGQFVYAQKCMSCHGGDGQGLPKPENRIETYPPLWGDHSYNEGAGLFRLSSFAGYVKVNMPLGANVDNPLLTDEEAWDLAAFVNSKPRPKHKFLKTDWPDPSKKPYDHPFGPYADTFSELQHKYGPYTAIIESQSKQ